MAAPDPRSIEGALPVTSKGVGAGPVRIDRLPDGSTGGGTAPGSATTVELVMTAADRRRVRRRITAPDGTVFELALPTGTVLPVGAVLHRNDGSGTGTGTGTDTDTRTGTAPDTATDTGAATVYRIAAAPERVIEVRPRSLAEAAQVGHTIGNLHRDVDVVGDVVLALWDAPLERRLRDAGLELQVVDRPFRGRAPGEHAHG